MSGRSCRNPACDRERESRRTGIGRRWALRGYCARCYRRWRDNGFQGPGPQPPRVSHVSGPGTAAGRIEDYGWLRREIGLSRSEAASRVGVVLETAMRYERVLARSGERWGKPEGEAA